MRAFGISFRCTTFEIDRVLKVGSAQHDMYAQSLQRAYTLMGDHCDEGSNDDGSMEHEWAPVGPAYLLTHTLVCNVE